MTITTLPIGWAARPIAENLHISEYCAPQPPLEDRCSPRIKLRIPAMLRPSGFKGFSVIIKDLSLSGFSAEALTAMKSGTRVFVTMPGLAALEAEIAWNDGTMVGCAFQNLLNQAVLNSILLRHSVDRNG